MVLAIKLLMVIFLLKLLLDELKINYAKEFAIHYRKMQTSSTRILLGLYLSALKLPQMLLKQSTPKEPPTF